MVNPTVEDEVWEEIKRMSRREKEERANLFRLCMASVPGFPDWYNAIHVTFRDQRTSKLLFAHTLIRTLSSIGIDSLEVTQLEQGHLIISHDSSIGRHNKVLSDGLKFARSKIRGYVKAFLEDREKVEEKLGRVVGWYEVHKGDVMIKWGMSPRERMILVQQGLEYALQQPHLRRNIIIPSDPDWSQPLPLSTPTRSVKGFPELLQLATPLKQIEVREDDDDEDDEADGLSEDDGDVFGGTGKGNMNSPLGPRMDRGLDGTRSPRGMGSPGRGGDATPAHGSNDLLQRMMRSPVAPGNNGSRIPVPVRSPLGQGQGTFLRNRQSSATGLVLSPTHFGPAQASSVKIPDQSHPDAENTGEGEGIRSSALALRPIHTPSKAGTASTSTGRSQGRTPSASGSGPATDTAEQSQERQRVSGDRALQRGTLFSPVIREQEDARSANEGIKPIGGGMQMARGSSMVGFAGGIRSLDEVPRTLPMTDLAGGASETAEAVTASDSTGSGVDSGQQGHSGNHGSSNMTSFPLDLAPAAGTVGLPSTTLARSTSTTTTSARSIAGTGRIRELVDRIQGSGIQVVQPKPKSTQEAIMKEAGPVANERGLMSREGGLSGKSGVVVGAYHSCDTSSARKYASAVGIGRLRSTSTGQPVALLVASYHQANPPRHWSFPAASDEQHVEAQYLQKEPPNQDAAVAPSYQTEGHAPTTVAPDRQAEVAPAQQEAMEMEDGVPTAQVKSPMEQWFATELPLFLTLLETHQSQQLITLSTPEGPRAVSYQESVLQLRSSFEGLLNARIERAPCPPHLGSVSMRDLEEREDRAFITWVRERYNGAPEPYEMVVPQLSTWLSQQLKDHMAQLTVRRDVSVRNKTTAYEGQLDRDSETGKFWLSVPNAAGMISERVMRFAKTNREPEYARPEMRPLADNHDEPSSSTGVVTRGVIKTNEIAQMRQVDYLPVAMFVGERGKKRKSVVEKTDKGERVDGVNGDLDLESRPEKRQK